MAFVLTLIADPSRRKLSAQAVDAARTALTSGGGNVGPSDWLSPDEACDLPFEGLSTLDAERLVREALRDLPVDLAAQPLAGRRKALLLADMESTIIAEEMLDELAETVGLRDEIAEVTARAMSGDLDFEEALEARVAKLAGLPLGEVERAAERMTFNPGARSLIRSLRAAGVPCILVSGGFTIFADLVAEACGFSAVRANVLEIEAGKLSGGVHKPILGRKAKLDALERLSAELSVTPAAACTVGDGANDLAMLNAAGLGVAYRGKPAVRAAARYALDVADLTGLLFYQGYRRADFAELG
ncbi:phosphoserine phosphatase SerB [Algihabitans albus]|uniref:phosphoserine phosphatase SerB n=1 Tax=Algihabitans albus TaxID=2164067 RepID=UPI000E5C6907|nr:phosphoserine phosphatase SerB [Algihabitans albus]